MQPRAVSCLKMRANTIGSGFSGSILMASATYLAPRHSAFRSRTLPSGLVGRRSPSKRCETLTMNKARLAALVTAVSETFMKSSKPQNCLASRTPKAELNLEPQAIIVDQRVAGERQVATEQNDMSPGLGLQIDFDQDHNIERLAELLVQALHLIRARFDLLNGRGVLQVLSWQVLVIEPVTVFLVRPMPLVEAVIGQVQGRVTTQLRNQV